MPPATPPDTFKESAVDSWEKSTVSPWPGSVMFTGRSQREGVGVAVAGERVGARSPLEGVAALGRSDDRREAADRIGLPRGAGRRDHADGASRPARQVDGDPRGVRGEVQRVAGALSGEVALRRARVELGVAVRGAVERREVRPSARERVRARPGGRGAVRLRVDGGARVVHHELRARARRDVGEVHGVAAC